MHQFEREPASFTPTSYFLKLNSYSVPISYNVSLHRLQFQQNILLVLKYVWMSYLQVYMCTTCVQYPQRPSGTLGLNL